MVPTVALPPPPHMRRSSPTANAHATGGDGGNGGSAGGSGGNGGGDRSLPSALSSRAEMSRLSPPLLSLAATAASVPAAAAAATALPSLSTTWSAALMAPMELRSISNNMPPAATAAEAAAEIPESQGGNGRRMLGYQWQRRWKCTNFADPKRGRTNHGYSRCESQFRGRERQQRYFGRRKRRECIAGHDDPQGHRRQLHAYQSF